MCADNDLGVVAYEDRMAIRVVQFLANSGPPPVEPSVEMWHRILEGAKRLIALEETDVSTPAEPEQRFLACENVFTLFRAIAAAGFGGLLLDLADDCLILGPVLFS